MRDELRILRSRHTEALEGLDRAGDHLVTGTAKMLGTVAAPSSGVTLAADKFVLFNPTDVGGVEGEGNPVSVVADTSQSQPGIVIGATPAAGDVLVFSAIGGRWIARKLGGGAHIQHGPGNIPSCFCQGIPSPLTMTSFDPACNFHMFQSCQIAWGPTPSWAAPLNLGANIFLSTSAFPDPALGGVEFYYYFTCEFNEFSITRLYPTSPFGSPYRDGILYTWLINDVTNTCDPFHLDAGLPFPGSDATCRVVIDS